MKELSQDYFKQEDDGVTVDHAWKFVQGKNKIIGQVPLKWLF